MTYNNIQIIPVTKFTIYLYKPKTTDSGVFQILLPFRYVFLLSCAKIIWTTSTVDEKKVFLNF